MLSLLEDMERPKLKNYNVANILQVYCVISLIIDNKNVMSGTSIHQQLRPFLEK